MIIYSQSTIRKVFVPLLSWIIWEGHVERMLFLFWPCPLLFSPLFRENLKCRCTVISHLMHSDKISLSILHVCFTDIFRGTKHLKMPSCTKKKKGIGSRYFLWLLTVKNMALSEVSKLSFIFIKCKSDFFFLPALSSCIESVIKGIVKSCKLLPKIRTTLSFLSSERRTGFCREKKHSLCRRTTFIPLLNALCLCSAGTRFASACQFFKRKALAFPD